MASLKVPLHRANVPFAPTYLCGNAFAAASCGQDARGTVVLDLASGHRLELKHLFVQESARGAGAGTALCLWAEIHGAQLGFNMLYLRVGIDNQTARRRADMPRAIAGGAPTVLSRHCVGGSVRRRLKGGPPS